MTLLPTLDKIAPGDGVFTYDVDRVLGSLIGCCVKRGVESFRV